MSGEKPAQPVHNPQSGGTQPGRHRVPVMAGPMGNLVLAGERRSRVVQIRLLGGVSATDDGDPLDVGPGRCQAVLAALAFSAGSAVPVWRLVELVWGETAPRTAEKTLQSYVTRLRKGLGPGSIVRSGAAYRLDVDADSVDVLRFQRH